MLANSCESFNLAQYVKKRLKIIFDTLIERLQDRSPLKRLIYILCILKFERLVEKLCKNEIITSVEADNNKNEFQIYKDTNTWKICFYLCTLSWAKPSRKRFKYQQKHSSRKPTKEISCWKKNCLLNIN